MQPSRDARITLCGANELRVGEIILLNHPCQARLQRDTMRNIAVYYYSSQGFQLSSSAERSLARQLVTRYSVLSHLAFEFVGSAPVDVLHCLQLGLVKAELYLFCAQLSNDD
jgi:hypothetical protein